MTLGERIPLAALDPRWWSESGDRSGQGISFLCPHCHELRIAIGFSNPIDRQPASTAVCRHWTRAGETFDDLTVRPSIDASSIGHWHGFITDGMAHQ